MAKFYKGNDGTIVGLLSGGENGLSSGEVALEELVAHDSSLEGKEKHVPLVHEEDGKVYVQVGSTLHPMLPEHYIEWIYLLTDKGLQRRPLHPGQEPKAVFYIAPDEVVLSVEAYCNKHGLWKADL